MANSNESDLATQIEQTDKTKGAFAAYQLYKENTANLSADGLTKLTNDLVAHGVLPDLAVAWGKEHQGELDQDHNSVISGSELASYKFFDGGPNSFEKAATQFLYKKTGDIQALDGTQSLPGLIDMDFDKYLNLQLSRTLAQDLKDNRPVFNALGDITHDDQQHFGYDQLQKFIDRCNEPDQHGDPTLYSAANRALVKSLQDNWGNLKDYLVQATGVWSGDFIDSASIAKTLDPNSFTLPTIDYVIAAPGDGGGSGAPGDGGGSGAPGDGGGSGAPGDGGGSGGRPAPPPQFEALSRDALLQVLSSDPQFLSRITDANGLITKESYAQAWKDEVRAEERGSSDLWTARELQAGATIAAMLEQLPSYMTGFKAADIAADDPTLISIESGLGMLH